MTSAEVTRDERSYSFTVATPTAPPSYSRPSTGATRDSVRMMPVFTSSDVGVINVINAKVNLLNDLSDGWLGEGSIAPKRAAIDDFRAFLRQLGSEVVLRAEPVGNAEGGLEVEWATEASIRVLGFTGDGLWLFENRGGSHEEATVTPFDVNRAVGFFGGQPI